MCHEICNLGNFGVTDSNATVSIQGKGGCLTCYMSNGQASRKDEDGGPCHSGIRHPACVIGSGPDRVKGYTILRNVERMAKAVRVLGYVPNPKRQPPALSEDGMEWTEIKGWVAA